MINTSRTFAIILLILFMSCNETPMNKGAHSFPDNSRTVQIKLIDTLGTITLSVPLRYDTSFSWTYYSDCGDPCNEQKYRFQPKMLRITKESGWIWLGEPKDSIERFTVSHAKYFPFHEGDTAENLIGHNHMKAELASNPRNPPIVFDTIEKIDDRYYSIIEMEKTDTILAKKILAVTTIKGNMIKFQYELLTGKADSITKHFIKNSIDLIHTIHISKGR